MAASLSSGGARALRSRLVSRGSRRDIVGEGIATGAASCRGSVVPRRRQRVADLFPVGDTPLVIDGSSSLVWGRTIDPAWCCDRARTPEGYEAIKRLSAISGKAYARSRSRFALEVAEAYAEVRSWERAGVPIRGTRWVDLGGSDGRYTVALKLCGATAVTLVDLYPPVIAAVPVLEAAGARVIVGDMRKIEPVDADATCFLHVMLPVASAFGAAPGVGIVVIDRFFGKRDAAMLPAGWAARTIKASDLHAAIERRADRKGRVAALRTTEQQIVWTPL